MVLEGTALGILSMLGFLGTYARLPEPAKKLVKRYPLMTDILATSATYKLLGGTLTALMAAGVMSVGISTLLFFPAVKRRLTRRKAQAES